MSMCLFENHESQTSELALVCNKYNAESFDFQGINDFLKEVEAVGYSFDYGLDGVPYNLRPINNLSLPTTTDRKKCVLPND